MDETTYKNYLYDLGTIVKELAIEAKKDLDSNSQNECSDYKTGYCMAFHRIVSLMQQQAEAFNIPFSKLNMSDIDADDDLI